jgi:hypothetical protein
VTDAEKANEWTRFIQASPEGYHMNAFLAVLEADGPQMVGRVLQNMKITSPLELIQRCK